MDQVVRRCHEERPATACATRLCHPGPAPRRPDPDDQRLGRRAPSRRVGDLCQRASLVAGTPTVGRRRPPRAVVPLCTRTARAVRTYRSTEHPGDAARRTVRTTGDLDRSSRSSSTSEWVGDESQRRHRGSWRGRGAAPAMGRLDGIRTCVLVGSTSNRDVVRNGWPRPAPSGSRAGTPDRSARASPVLTAASGVNWRSEPALRWARHTDAATRVIGVWPSRSVVPKLS